MAQVTPNVVPLRGGLDVVTSPMFTKDGTLRVAYNYEAATGGGYERVGGIERFDGRAAPNLAAYALLELAAVATVALGATITGATSGATARVIYASGKLVGITRIVGVFQAEAITVAAAPAGAIASLTPVVDGFLDNTLAALAAADYRTDVARVPGSGPVRGLAVLNDTVLAWRNDAAGTAQVVHKATAAGWVALPLYHQVAFTNGTAEPAEGATLTQSSVSATIKRVVLESGSWSTSNAAGRLIITAPTGGVFSGGVAGAVTLTGASAQIVRAPGGRVRHDVATFTGAADTNRLYGCDGVNPEFELADDILVPLNTGMAAARATAVCVHRSHLFFAYKGSLQHSGIGAPYKWAVISGAAELGTGDAITDLVSVAGSELAAAMMVLCRNSVLVLYGDAADGDSPWVLKTLSRVSGVSAGSAQDVAGVVALDAPGFVRYPPTQAFGNYRWDSVSQQIEPIARAQECACSVWVTDRSKYRVFFEDGTAVSGVPVGKGQFEWTTLDYGRAILLAEHAEVAGIARTFYADGDGWVYEADVGRSFAGEAIRYAVRVNELDQDSPSILKDYRRVELECEAQSAFTLSASADFSDGENASSGDVATLPQYGAGLRWDLGLFDQTYWDVPAVSRKRLPFEGQGTSVSISLAGESPNELPHTLKAITVHHIKRRTAR